MPSVYVETSIISYLAARPSRDLIVAARQQLTHAWWRERRPVFDLYVSQVVLDQRVPLPTTAGADAAHIATAAYHRIDFLMTWNSTHIANAELRPRVEQVCRENGYPAPVLCTPDELMGGSDD